MSDHILHFHAFFTVSLLFYILGCADVGESLPFVILVRSAAGGGGVGVLVQPFLVPAPIKRPCLLSKPAVSGLVDSHAGVCGGVSVLTSLLRCPRTQRLNRTKRLNLAYERDHQKGAAYSSFLKIFPCIDLDFNSCVKLLTCGH